MIVTLDGNKLDGSFRGHESLRSLIDQVRKDTAGQRLVVSVTVNGERFIEEGLDERLASPVGDEDQINLESYDRTELVADALREMAQKTGAAIATQTTLAEQLNKGDSAAALEGIGEFILLWQTCQKTIVQSCDILRRNLTLNEYAGKAGVIAEELQPAEGQLPDLSMGAIRSAIQRANANPGFAEQVFSTYDEYFRIAITTEVNEVQAHLEAVVHTPRDAADRTASSVEVLEFTLD